MKICIVTDSAVELPIGYEKPFIHIVPVQIIIKDEAYLDGEVPPDKFSEAMSMAKINTSQPSIQQFIDTYESLMDEYDKIISIHISSYLSGTKNSARNAANEVAREHILIFDTYNVSIGASYSVLLSAMLIENNINIYEIEKILTYARNKIQLMVLINDARFLQRGGRINLVEYSLLRFFRIKPIISIKDGRLVKHKLALGRRHGYSTMMNSLELKNENPDKIYLIGKSGEIIIEDFIEKLHVDETKIYRYKIGLALTVHAGPNAIGIAIAPSFRDLVAEYHKNIVSPYSK